MTSLDDLYGFYCRRCDVKPNSGLSKILASEYAANGQLRRMRRVDVSSTYVGVKGLPPVLLLAKNVAGVEELDLSSNMITQRCLPLLQEHLQGHPTLVVLRLDRNQLHDGAVAALLSLVAALPALQRITLAHNDLSTASVGRVEAALADRPPAAPQLTPELAQREADAAAAATADSRPTSAADQRLRPAAWRAALSGEVTAGRAGGSLQFASWRDNAQYALFTSHTVEVTLRLKVVDPSPTMLAGFAVLHGDQHLRQVLLHDGARPEPGPRNLVVAESGFGETGATLALQLPAAPRQHGRPYVVVPFAFNPGRTFKFTLECELPLWLNGGLVTMEPMDPRLDWAEARTAAEWTPGTAGGPLSLPSWRENAGHRVTYAGPRSAGTVRGVCVLSKTADDDDNDDTEIGMALLAPDAHGRVPLTLKRPGTVLATLPAARHATVALPFQFPAATCDFVVVPFTGRAGVAAPYTLTVYTNAAASVERMPPHAGWAWQQLPAGVWDADRCGGARDANATSWVHAPSYVVTVPEDDGPLPTVELMASLTADLDGGRPMAHLPDPDAAPGATDVAAVLYRCDDVETSAVASSPWVAAGGPSTDAELVASVPPGRYFLVPTARQPGRLGRYTLKVVSTRPVHVSPEAPLAHRLRDAELRRHAADSAAQRKAIQAAVVAEAAAPDAALPTQPAGAVVPQDEAAMAAAAAIRSAAIAAYDATGDVFVDRDFPPAASSLWKNAVAPPLRDDVPPVQQWRPACEVLSDAPGLSAVAAPRLRGAVPAGVDSAWVHSALAMVTTRPEVARGFAVAALPEYGVYQFAFRGGGVVDVVTVDSHLPVDGVGALCFSRGVDGNDAWVPFAEKAFAKRHRCYEALDLAASRGLEESPDPEPWPGGVGASAVSRALTDITGGVSLETRLHGQQGRAFVQDGMWAQLRRARDPSCIVGLRLTPHTPSANEKQGRGISMDRLYPVIDARSVSGTKLVKVRNFWGWNEPGCGHASAQWGGHCGAASQRWTPELRRAVGYDSSDTTSFWLTAEEVGYYFGTLHVLLLPTNGRPMEARAAGRYDPQEGGPAVPKTGGTDDAWRRNAQYRLDVGGEIPEGGVTVVVGLRRPDAMRALIRSDTARADYDAPLGLSVVRTGDNRRRLRAVTLAEEVAAVAEQKARDVFLPVTVLPGHKYLVIPHSGAPDQAAEFAVTAWLPPLPSGEPQCATTTGVTVAFVPQDSTVSVDGAWDGDSAGGPPSFALWRDNPQYLLQPSKTSVVTLVLRQRNCVASTTAKIGLCVVSGTSAARVLEYRPADVVAVAPHDNAGAVRCTVTLDGVAERCGRPYVVVPSTLVPGETTGFSLEAVCNVPVQLRPVGGAPQDFRRRAVSTRFSFRDGTSGGPLEYPSWRNNPQFAITLPACRSGTLRVAVTKRCDRSAAGAAEGEGKELGVLLMQGDPHDGGRRRKVLATVPAEGTPAGTESAVVARSPITTGAATELQYEFRDQRRALVVMPFCGVPYDEFGVDVTVYCSADFELAPVKEWHLAVAEGTWRLGVSAGGAREASPKTYGNNPFFSVAATGITRAVAVLLQYPHGPERPVPRNVQRTKVYLPTPIVNAGRKASIGFDVTEGGVEAVTALQRPMHASRHAFEAEVAEAFVLPPTTREPHVIVPHSYDPEQPGDFALMLYTDAPVQLQPVDKPKRFF